MPIVFIASVAIFSILIILNHHPLISFLMALYVLIDSIVIITRQITRGLGKNKHYSTSAIINSIFNVVLAVLLLSIFDTGLSGLLVSLNIALGLSLIFLLKNIYIFKKVKNCRPDINYIKLLLKFSIPMVPNSLSLWVVQVSDRLIVTAMLGIEANAIYAVANKIPGMFAIAYNTFNMAWQESASITYADNDSSEYYSDIFDGLFKFLVGVMAILIGFTPIMFKLLVRGPYDDAYYQMPILFLGIFFSSLSAFYGGIYLALKETKRIGITSILGATINFLINITLIRYIGLFAASISTLVSYFLLTIFRLVDTQKLRKIDYNWRNILISLLFLIIMSLISYQRNAYFNLINILLGLFIGFISNKKLIRNAYQTIIRRRRSR